MKTKVLNGYKNDKYSLKLVLSILSFVGVTFITTTVCSCKFSGHFNGKYAVCKWQCATTPCFSHIFAKMCSKMHHRTHTTPLALFCWMGATYLLHLFFVGLSGFSQSLWVQWHFLLFFFMCKISFFVKKHLSFHSLQNIHVYWPLPKYFSRLTFTA